VNTHKKLRLLDYAAVFVAGLIPGIGVALAGGPKWAVVGFMVATMSVVTWCGIDSRGRP
jgi:hypothetical protein